MNGNYIYWISTTLLSLLYLSSAALYIFKKYWVRQTIVDFGYPGYLLPILIVVKILFVTVILSRFSVAVSDFAYAGALCHLLLSALAHIGIRKPSGALPATVGLVLLATSFLTQNAAHETPSPYAPAAASYQKTTN